MADTYNSSDKSYRAKIAVHSTLRMIFCIILTIICLIPIYILVVNATRSSNDIIDNGVSLIPSAEIVNNLKNLHDPTKADGAYVRTINVWIGYRNSLIISAASTILTVFFSAMTAYGLVVYDFKMKKPATTFILAIMMIPMQVVSTGFLQFMVTLNLTDNYIPLIVPAIAAPSVVFFMLQYMQSSFPLDIVEAARIDGCGEFRTFLQISLPIFKPAFAVQAIFAFVASWNNYYTPSMILLSGNLNMKTIPMMVVAVQNNNTVADFGVKYLTVALSIIPVVVIYLLLSKFIVKGVALGAVKG